MGVVVHHSPAGSSSAWSLFAWRQAWDGNMRWDDAGVRVGDVWTFRLPAISDPRRLAFTFHPVPGFMDQDGLVADVFTRRLTSPSIVEVWTFEGSARVLGVDPRSKPPLRPGDAVTVHAMTRNRYRGGRLYAWTPYDAGMPAAFFPETARDDARGVSTFEVPLAAWMTAGFNFKLAGPAPADAAAWEPDVANRVWRPCDGASVWIKSGRCDLSADQLAAASAPIEVMYGASMTSPPILTLTDLAERVSIPVPSSSSAPYAGRADLRIATYAPEIFPGAAYAVSAPADVEASSPQRPFPAQPAVPGSTSRFVLGTGGWVGGFPSMRTVTLAVQPRPASGFGGGLSVGLSLGNGPPYRTEVAVLQPDGTWTASLTVPIDATVAITLLPADGPERRPYDRIDARRFVRVSAATTVLHTTEGVFGVCEGGPTRFADPPDRAALMAAAFGERCVDAGTFAGREMPHGATLVDGATCFVVHAPHAVRAALVRIPDIAPTQARIVSSMTLTGDGLYWWCAVPIVAAPAGTRYRFLLNDRLEVVDPAAREVVDGGPSKGSNDGAHASGSWAVVLDVARVHALAHAHPWRTRGWESFLVYELHARRFTDLQQGALTPFEVVADELAETSRRGARGYLRALPATILALLPVNTFSSDFSWGYDPSFYFAVDGGYGGAVGLAGLVDAAHAAGRGVTLDVVYNHSLGSPLMAIASDVYRCGDYDGDLMCCGHPMLTEHLRQAGVHLMRTFGLDGFRFDDTRAIVTRTPGGWEFLRTIRDALRTAASAEGRDWPHCVAENHATSPWDVSDPGFGVMDGEWDIDEVYRIRDATFDVGRGDAGPLRDEMLRPRGDAGPFFQAMRFGESHDMVSGQDPANRRIAARPPFGRGLRMAKAMGCLTLLSRGIPMLFMGQEVGETSAFSFDDNQQWVNPQAHDLPPDRATPNTRVLGWFRQIMGLRCDPTKGLQGDGNRQGVATGDRTVAFTCGHGLFAVVTFGTPDLLQDSSWLGLPAERSYKEIFNSSWPDFQVEAETEHGNGGYDARLSRGQTLRLPEIGAVVLEAV